VQIPETPSSVLELDLMKRLDDYAQRRATCNLDASPMGPSAQQTCKVLHGQLAQLVSVVLAPLLDRANAREMDTFTMHDHTHGLKVAHLMWHILTPEKREHLTPPEIVLMVCSAFLHDLGMSLTKDERDARLDPASDLWDKLEIQPAQKEAIERLRVQVTDPNTAEPARDRAIQKLAQAEEALLSQDTRDRHALAARYVQVLKKLDEYHQEDRTRIPDVESCLSLEGDSFRDKLIEICVSHNEDAEALVKRDDKNPSRPRFPTDYPVGHWNANLHMVAAALRLADILDFDRERTPAVLFYYLLPGNLDPADNRSVLEWGKHLTISNWHTEDDAIVFRGRCTSHILHHAVVQFCTAIAKEIEATRATFGALGSESSWPFALPSAVEPKITEDGYHYVPYQFELDDERVYQLLMGGAIYDDPLVAVRELVQNAVDACKLRDALTQLVEPVVPSTTDRIFVRYEEPTDDCPQPKLVVTDTGTGMDALILERYFLKVGRSYYNSSEFNQHRIDLRRKGLDFAPVSEFGIGFLSCFLLADRIEVETAMWEDVRGDTRKRILQIDGPTRLIRLDEQRNEGSRDSKGPGSSYF
jgi:molecular chaperone HtpG